MISIDSGKCTGCGTCNDLCQNYVFEVNERAKVRNEKQCCECGQCVYGCPSEAIQHDAYPNATREELPAVSISSDDLFNLMMSRRSVRTFKDTPVEDEDLEMLLNAAFNAGSSSNGQSEGFVIIKDKDFMNEVGLATMDVLWNAGLKFLGNENGFMSKLLVKKYGKEMIRQYVRYHHVISSRREDDVLAEQVFRNAPMAIILHGIKSNINAYSNSAVALRNIELLAMAKGLGSCWGGFLIAASEKSNKINKMLGIPKDRIITGALLLGYPKHTIKYKIPRSKRDVVTI